MRALHTYEALPDLSATWVPLASLEQSCESTGKGMYDEQHMVQRSDEKEFSTRRSRPDPGLWKDLWWSLKIGTDQS